jgi:hypothetical protein
VTKKGEPFMLLSLKCSECSGEMKEGLVVDLSYAGILRSIWVEEQTGEWVGTMANNKGKAKTITYRCANCGFLDSYAK